jgi:hypothetical protein
MVRSLVLFVYMPDGAFIYFFFFSTGILFEERSLELALLGTVGCTIIVETIGLGLVRRVLCVFAAMSSLRSPV